MAFKRYKTPSGARVTLDESWAGPRFKEIQEDPLGVDGRPKPPIYPAKITLQNEKIENHSEGGKK